MRQSCTVSGMSFRCAHATSKGCGRCREGRPLLESSPSQVAIFYGLVMNNVADR